MQIIINAGGEGTRLWPLSTKEIPKQFCKIIEDKTLLNTTYDRLSKNFDAKNIWVNINQKHLPLLKQLLPEISDKQILTEPERRDTFPAVVSHAAVVAHYTSKDEPIVFINSDHYISPASSEIKHNQAFQLIEKSLKEDGFNLVVAGIKPTFPSCQYGYIEVPKDHFDTSFSRVVPVNSFKEKPIQEVAEKYLQEGGYLWNLGAFCFKFSKLEKMLSQILPDAVDPLNKIYQTGVIDLNSFQKLPKTSFDYAVLEKTDKLGVIGMELEKWDDIGGYDTLYNYLKEVNTIEKKVRPTIKFVQIEGEGNKAQTQQKGRKVAFVGVSNLVLIETEEGILVIDPKKSPDVKKVSSYFESI